MGENIFENLQRVEYEGLTLKELVLSPSSKRTTSIITFLAILVLLLAVLLIAVTVLWQIANTKALSSQQNGMWRKGFELQGEKLERDSQKERKLQELEGVAQKYNTSLHLCNVSYASLENSKRNILGLVFAGWRFYNGSFYFFSNEAKPWQEAEQACMSQRAHLTSVTSREEMKFLVKKSRGQPFWIGLMDQREEGNWTWTDGTRYNHQVSFWEAGQPDNWSSAPEQREDCVHFRNNELQSWNDNSCGTQLRWICKKVFP